MCGYACYGHVWNSEDNLWGLVFSLDQECSEDWTQVVRLVAKCPYSLSHFASPPLCFKGGREREVVLVGPRFGKGRVIFRGSSGGLSLTPPSCSSSCREHSEGGIMFLLVTLPRMRGNPQSVGFGGGVGIWWQVIGQGN